MHEIKAVIRPSRLDAVMAALQAIPDLPGVTVSRVHAYGRAHPRDPNATPRGLEADFVKLETVIPADLTERVTEAIRVAAHTGGSGDGMIFVSAVQGAIRIRTGDRNVAAL